MTLLLMNTFGVAVAAIIGGAVVVITRLLSIKFDLHLPKFKS